MANRAVRSTAVVRHDTVGIETARRPVDEDERRPGASLFVQIGVIPARRNDDDAVDATLAERSDQLALAHRVLVAAPGEDEHAALARSVLDRAMERRRERVRDVLEHEP